jgi:2-desacetyl-2-hydroxyethyl bacteriochlorophyllide A dehydrogenase
VLGAVFQGPRDIRIAELPDPEPAPGEAIVRVRAAGICGGDLHEYRAGKQLYPVPYPRPAQGHELAGEVVAVGAGVAAAVTGDRVAVMPMVSCGQCAECRSGRFALCPSLEHIGVARGGGFAELCAAPEQNLFRLPDGVGDEEAALLDCAAVAVHAIHRVPVREGARVTVLGAGAIGQAVAQLARVAGAGHVTVVGTRAAPLELARELGADATVDLSAGEEPPGDAQVLYETAGGADMLSRALAAAGPGAGIGLVGETFAAQTFDPAAAISRELTLAFVWSYGVWEGRSEYATALDLVASRRVRLAPLVTHRYPLSALEEAFAAAADRGRSGAVKVMVTP